MKLLLVEPNFPVPAKSKNHSHFLPIGLLKIGSYHKLLGDTIKFVRGNKSSNELNFLPDEIKITSLFTYWSPHVVATTLHYRKLFPKAKIQVGGIFASLMPDKCKELTKCDEVVVGLYNNGAAEIIDVDYNLLDEEIDYQIIHTSRGCFRKCNFCGTWKIEPETYYKSTIQNEIKKNKLVIYDNNLLANPFIDDIFQELSEFKLKNKSIVSESQSGLDGRLLLKNPQLAAKMKKAKFQNPRLAWDGSVEGARIIKEQIEILKEVGYKANKKDANIYLFMLYNHRISYDEMCEKLEYCRKWGVLTIDCRFRPLDSLEDKYNPRAKSQNELDYFIHKGWNDNQVRSFRKKVRRQNIAIRLGLPKNKYIEGVEKTYITI